MVTQEKYRFVVIRDYMTGTTLRQREQKNFESLGSAMAYMHATAKSPASRRLQVLTILETWVKDNETQ